MDKQNSFYEGFLFTDADFEDNVGVNEETAYSCSDSDLLENLQKQVTLVGNYEMPAVEPYNGDLPEHIGRFEKLILAVTYGIAPHFFTDDRNFERIWLKFFVYARKLKHFVCVIGPDFSLYLDMPYSKKIYNSFRNKLITALWQKLGIKVIPNVSWSDGDMDMYLDGFPKNSVIAINSTGLRRDKHSIDVFRRGYKAVLERLKPVAILRYGCSFDWENKEISKYYDNSNKIR